VEREATDAVSLTVRPVDGGAVPPHRPGQHVTVSLTPDAAVTRSYSLSDAPRGDRYRITVQRLGAFSRHVHDALSTGGTVSLSAPAGGFTLPAEPDLPVVLVAGGVGITPFLALLEALRRPVTLYYGVRNGARHPSRQRLRELAEEVDGLRVVTYYSRPAPGDLRERDYDHRGRIAAAALPAELVDARARFYLCGPEAMVADLRAGLRQRGVPD